MSIFIKTMVIHKLRQLTTEDLLQYAREYDFPINKEEAAEISSYLKKADINPFQSSGRAAMMKELAAITSPEVAKSANELFLQLIRANGVEHLFNS
ncbi:DUF2624 domain-containing protein [Aciduricibacillus chroicocephali]|uniref:DUF2624 domain-containing protein n=1 Tax=Aciduricibacillus chroicocephali TaxID=3054939 RepID=A0ABY9KS87_9BACI|nr:DUF2624 domain-containing protein [Bacillaceae bacterium 44XB]